MTGMDEKFRYSVRESRRARQIILRINPRTGLEVVVPAGFPQGKLPAFLAAKRSWIEKHLRARAEQNPPPPDNPAPPQSIVLSAVNRTFQVEYREVTGRFMRLRQTGDQSLVLFGPPDAPHHWAKLLKGWLLNQGRRHLEPWLTEVSHQTGLAFHQVRVRCQKTRWGSCSARQDISLNCRLLLLRPETARYVLVHELCHTVFLNHSAKYWSLVARFEPFFQARNRELKAAEAAMPWWSE